MNQDKKQNNTINLQPRQLKDLLATTFPPEIWLVESLIPDEGVTILSGSPGSFKTWLYMEIAVKVSTGSLALGHFPTKQTGVLIIDEESGERRMQKRFKQLAAKGDMPIHFTSRVGYKMSKAYAETIVSKADELKAGLVIFDSFTRFNGADENASGDMATLMDCYHQLADAGLAVLILHHNRKGTAGPSNPAAEMRGSSDILAAADCHIAVSRVGQSEFVRLTQTKNRDIWEPQPFELRFHENAAEFEYVGTGKSSAEWHREQLDEIVSFVGANPGLSQRQIVTQIKTQGFKGGNRKIMDLLDELTKN
ncbi:MAG TPA: AAA family ATPase, partial [Candidatus Saccharimonadales bacterium]|nr:AAA family ATPase [Candidatus Saccharimonadales bacterium]